MAAHTILVDYRDDGSQPRAKRPFKSKREESKKLGIMSQIYIYIYIYIYVYIDIDICTDEMVENKSYSINQISRILK